MGSFPTGTGRFKAIACSMLRGNASARSVSAQNSAARCSSSESFIGAFLRPAATAFAFPGAGGQKRSGAAGLLPPLNDFHGIDTADDGSKNASVDPEALGHLSYVFEKFLGTRPKAEFQTWPVRFRNSQLFP